MKKYIIFVLLGFVSLSAAAGDRFSFVALGDTAYTDNRYDEYRELIRSINKSKPDFTIHVGDTIGFQKCTDETYDMVSGFFESFKHPLVYTPGDNEWVDCYDNTLVATEGYHSDSQLAYKLNRLTEIRKRFFSTTKSLGGKALSMERQSDVSDFKEMVENRIWQHRDVLFATLHVTGSHDNMNSLSLNLAEESVSRRRANLSWLQEITRRAIADKPKAVVIAMHAELFDVGASYGMARQFSGTKVRGGIMGPYSPIVVLISRLAQEFKGPILLVNGDYHEFIVNRPMMVTDSETEISEQKFANVTRLQVFGSPELKAVKVIVEPDTPWVFSFSPLY